MAHEVEDAGIEKKLDELRERLKRRAAEVEFGASKRGFFYSKGERRDDRVAIRQLFHGTLCWRGWVDASGQPTGRERLRTW